MGGLGSGRPKQRGRKVVGSCWELDANELSAQGRLEPGQSSIRPLAIGNGAGGSVVVALNLRAEAGCLYLSWRSPIAASGEERDGTDRNRSGWRCSGWR